MTKFENKVSSALIKAVTSSLPDISKLELKDSPFRLPSRRGYGTRGLEVVLWANYLPIKAKTDVVLQRYTIEVTPAIPKTERRKKLQLNRLLLEEIGLSEGIATDFSSTIITTSPLPQNKTSVSIPYRYEGEETSAPNATTYSVRLTQPDPGSFSISQLMSYLSDESPNATFPALADMVQILNILMGFHPKSEDSIMSVGANRHYPLTGDLARPFDLGQGLEAWRGAFMSVRLADTRILMNIQPKALAAYKPKDLMDLIVELLGKTGNQGYGPGQMHKLQGFLKNVRVRTTHLPEKRNKKNEIIPHMKSIHFLANVDDGQGSNNPATTPIVTRLGANAKNVQFYDDNSHRHISVFDWFRSRYRITAPDNMPVVNVGTKAKPSYLPVNVCEVIRGQPARAKLSGPQTSNMIQFAVRKPFENATSVVSEAPVFLGLNPTCKTLTSFGFHVENQMVTVRGRILQGPQVFYKNGRANTRDGSWNMENNKFHTGAHINILSVCRIKTRNDQRGPDDNLMKTRLKSFGEALAANGIVVNRWMGDLNASQILEYPDAGFEKKLRTTFDNARNFGIDGLLVILPEKDAELYARIKTVGDQLYGIQTVCAVAYKFTKPSRKTDGPDLQYFANLCLKFNLKFGGTNQKLDDGALKVLGSTTMIVGLDVTHPSPSSKLGSPSIAGIVASINKELSQWPAAFSAQESRQEMIADLVGLLKGRLKYYQEKNNGALPQSIIIFRDGISWSILSCCFRVDANISLRRRAVYDMSRQRAFSNQTSLSRNILRD